MNTILCLVNNKETDSTTITINCTTAMTQKNIHRTIKIDNDLLKDVQFRCVSFIEVPRKPSALSAFIGATAMHIHSKSQHTTFKIGITIAVELTKALIEYAVDQVATLELMDTNPDKAKVMVEAPPEVSFRVLTRNVEVATKKVKPLPTLDEYQLEQEMKEQEKAHRDLMALEAADQQMLDDMNNELKNLFS